MNEPARTPTSEGRSEAARIRVAMLVFPEVDLLDVMGPIEVLGVDTAGAGCGAPRIQISLVSVDPELLVEADPRVRFMADLHLGAATGFDVILVPGGAGLVEVLDRPDVLDWLRREARGAAWVCSICAGALLLGAAGLLDGHVATTHWASLASLGLFPEVQVAAGYPRVVVSGGRMTSGGVSAALDLAIVLKSALLGERAGRDIELVLQYDPEAPYGVGRPDRADPVTLCGVSRWLRPMVERRNAVIRGLKG